MEVLEIAKGKDLFINEQIRAKEVLVIGPNGEQLGVKSRSDALTLASAAGFDLVQMGGKPEQPVCKLMDYNKYKYEDFSCRCPAETAESADPGIPGQRKHLGKD